VSVSIQIVDHKGDRSSLTLDPGRRYSIGRSNSSDIALMDVGLSRRHAELFHDGGRWMVADCGSSNGTYTGGRRVVEPVPIEEGVPILLGSCRICIGQERAPARDVSFIDGPVVSLGTVTFAAADVLGETGALDSPAARMSADHVATLKRRFGVVQRATLDLLGQEPVLESLLPRVLALVSEAVGADRAALIVREADGTLVSKAFRGDNPEGFTISTTIANRVIDEKISMLVSDVAGDAGLVGAKSLDMQGIRAVMAAPLWSREEVNGLIYADSLALATSFGDEELKILTMLGNIAAMQIQNARLFGEQLEKKRFEREARAAAEIQSRLLPTRDPVIPLYHFTGRNIPCHEVGGDYFDCVPMGGGRHGVIIADVAGKGMGAALMMAALQATYHARAETGPDLEHLAGKINEAICQRAPENRFVTAFLADVDSASHRVRYVNAGHAPPPMLVKATGSATLLLPGGPPLGLFEGFGYRLGEFTFEPGDILFACSDGVTDVMEPGGEMFGDDRLRILVKSLAGRRPEEIRESMLEAIARFAGGTPQPDDLTIIALQRDPVS